MDLKTPGVFALTDSMTGSQIASFVRKIEKLGYGSFWFPEAFGRDPFALAAHILGVTERRVVGTGIANVWKREAVKAARTDGDSEGSAGHDWGGGRRGRLSWKRVGSAGDGHQRRFLARRMPGSWNGSPLDQTKSESLIGRDRFARHRGCPDRDRRRDIGNHRRESAVPCDGYPARWTAQGADARLARRSELPRA
jgi:Luciferase-like monooxygenase